MAKPKSKTSTEVSTFSFTNSHGGTGMSNWDANAKFPKATAKVRLVKAWEDYETGLRFIGISDDPALTEYLGTVTAADDGKTVYFSEYELTRPQEAKKLIQRFADEVGVVRTSDGYSFRRDETGQWTDGDMTFKSLSQMMEEVDISIDIGGDSPVEVDRERDRQG